MPEKHANTERWGGPGSSHEDRSKPMPSKQDPRPEGTPTNPPVSQVSGGGGERDARHSHDDRMRSSKSADTTTQSPASDRDFRENAPRKH